MIAVVTEVISLHMTLSSDESILHQGQIVKNQVNHYQPISFTHMYLVLLPQHLTSRKKLCRRYCLPLSTSSPSIIAKGKLAKLDADREVSVRFSEPGL